MTPIDKLREALTKLGARALAGGLPVYLGEPLTEARAALDELAAQLAEASAVNDRIATILDEAVSMMPVMPAQEALTLLEEHVHSLRMAVEIAQRREPTQAEGDAHAFPPPNGAPDDSGDWRDECFVAAGGWTGRRCRVCRRWVWGGPTACVQCVAAEERAQLSAQPKALEWIDPREAPDGVFVGLVLDDEDPDHKEPIFEVDEMDARTREMGWADEKYAFVLMLSALPPIPTKGPTDG